MEVTTARVLDKRRILKKTNSYKLAIRVTYNRTPVPFPVDIHLTIDEFKKLNKPNIGERLRDIRDKSIAEENRAKEIIEKIGTFTFQAFRDEFYKDKKGYKRKKAPKDNPDAFNAVVNIPNPKLPTPSEGFNKKYGKRKYDRIRSNVDYEKMGPLAVAYGEYIKLLELQERIGTSESYFSALMSLLKFKKHLRLEDITVPFLYKYEHWFLSQGRSITTVGIYIRTIRAIINLPENRKLFTDDTYPFGRRKYVIPRGVNIKKALEPYEVKLLYEYKPDSLTADTRNELFAKDMWFFGFFANGINTKDIACLKYKNIYEDGFIRIFREKTKFTTRGNPVKIDIPINEDMQRIIDTWGNKDKNPENYIFPVLEENLSAHRKRELVQGFTGIINDWMKHICEKVGIKKKVRTMEYRHTMATMLRNAGAGISFIQAVMGHTDPKTTQNYFDSYDVSVKRKFSEQLLSFKNASIPNLSKKEIVVQTAD
jgi:integrase/recombinase XerD